MRRTQDSETQTRRPCQHRSPQPARLTSEVGDVMMSEHGCRAWVLGQGQAATGTNTHSTSCGQQRASQSRPHAHWPQSHKTFPGPAPPGTFLLPLSKNTHHSEAPEGVTKGPLGQCAPGLEGGSPTLCGQGGCPQAHWVGAAGPRALPIAPPGTSLVARTQVEGSWQDQG